MSLIRYSFENLQFRDVVAATREHLSRIALLDVDPLHGEQLQSVGMEMRVLPGVAVGKLWCSAGRARRTAAHVADGNDNVMLVMPVDTGMVIGRRGQRETMCHAGDVFVWPCDEPTAFTYARHCTTLNVALPRVVLDELSGRGREHLMTAIGAGAMPDLWLLRSYAALLIGGGELRPEAEQLAAAHLQDLVSLLLGSGSGSGSRSGRNAAAHGQGVRAARLQAIRADILANVARPLTADAMARRHGISPRYLRALFAAAGTSYTDVVMELRLARARSLLADPRLGHIPIGTIAYRCGFDDLAYFSRAFRRQYGYSPSSARVAPGTREGDPN